MFSLIPTWLEKHFIGFDQLTEKYITNGNTDSLNLVFLSNKFNKIYTLEKEYIYYSHLSQSLSIPIVNFNLDNLDILSNDGIVCLSVPSARDGIIENKQKIIDYCQEKNIPIFIDVAYCGLTEPYQISIKNTSNTYFAITFSKTLTLAYNRIGVLYCGKPVVSLSILNKLGYVNLSAANIAIELIKQFPCDYIYNTYKDQYLEICARMNLKPTKCILFGHDQNNEKFSVTEYYKTF